jgi:CubicO group peptidase (beta-lactamase class C family)
MAASHLRAAWLALLPALCSSAGAARPQPESVFPDRQWATAAPAQVGMDEAKLRQARDYALTGEGSGFIVRHGKVVMTWGDQRRRYDLKSTTKALGVTALGLAIADGKVKLDDRAIDRHPTIGLLPEDNNADDDRRGRITLLHLATQTAGFDKPGGYNKLLFEPGARWFYSDAGPNWLAECLTLAYRRDLRDLLFERVFTPIGISPDDLAWRDNAYRPKLIDGIPRREFGSGISADVDAMARIGYLYLREGRWRDRQLLPKSFVDQARTTVPGVAGLPPYDPKNEHGDASGHYGLLWWNNADGTLANVPRDAYWSWGLYDSLTVVIPSLDLVVARAGKSWKRDPGAGHYDVLKPFFEPIVASVRDAPPQTQQQGQIRSIEWAPPETIARRAARGSDNWPMTWADDDSLLTAYGDGRGFEPFVPEKLSLGFARVTGSPPDFTGENLRSPTGEQRGDGRGGRKASGLLMVDGTLYLIARNANHAQLSSSRDRGRTWTWADWAFDTSFGCPTFVNFGRNYAGARDDYVYVVSPDADDAYTPADRAVLARAPKDRVMDRGAYEFFERTDEQGRPTWTSDVRRRGAVLERPAGCLRCGVTYDAPLKCYLWVMTTKAKPPAGSTVPDPADARTWAGLVVYQSPEPWGPWTLLYEADRWDTHPGDSASFPTKWISADGRTLHLVFSGDDTFAVRRVRIR